MRKLRRRVSSLILTVFLGIGCQAGLVFSGAFGTSMRMPQVSPNSRELASFPHQSQKHRTLACSTCHVITPEEIEVKGFPGHAACISCHNFAVEGMTKPDLFCGICHASKAVSKSRPALFQFPKRRLVSDFGDNFSHPSHLKAQMSDVECGHPSTGQAVSPAISLQAIPDRTPRCADCHRKVEPVNTSLRELTSETGHLTCFKCHCEHPKNRPAMPSRYDCASCHQLNGPLPPRLFNLVKGFKHDDHQYDTRPKRKADWQKAKSPDHLCAECHQAVVIAPSLREIRLPEENYCAECHNGKVGLPDALAKEITDSLKRH